jgi:hypothetical protein
VLCNFSHLPTHLGCVGTFSNLLHKSLPILVFYVLHHIIMRSNTLILKGPWAWHAVASHWIVLVCPDINRVIATGPFIAVFWLFCPLQHDLMDLKKFRHVMTPAPRIWPILHLFSLYGCLILHPHDLPLFWHCFVLMLQLCIFSSAIKPHPSTQQYSQLARNLPGRCIWSISRQ